MPKAAYVMLKCGSGRKRQCLLRAEFDGRAMIFFALVAEVHVNAMSTSVRHFVPVYDHE
jgi:hypothetical protein